MALSTDPITGAPLISPDPGFIDQLPYKVQPVPLQDQTNQPQLGRTYLYPDDVPPVLANLNAMNGSQTDQAQTLHTDGEHRLLVASSGGGGGNSPVTPTGWGFSMQHLPISGGGSTGFGVNPINILYYMNWSLTAWADAFAPNDPIDCKFFFEQFSGGGPNMTFAQFTAYLASATPASPFTVSGNAAFPFPIDLSFINGAVGYQLMFEASGDITGHVSASYVGTV